MEIGSNTAGRDSSRSSALDRCRIIACINGKLADLNFNILGISQTIMGDRFDDGIVFQIIERLEPGRG
jgi:predicted amino acid-binding ACT domain protein